MRPENRDIAFLWDMREAARDILEFTAHVTAEHFAANKILRYAVERQLAVLGEAARQVSIGFKQSHADIAWDAFISRRNLIIHDYGEITAERVWRVITNELPGLLTALDPLIPSVPPDDPVNS
ncbi:MAG: DUF86 domain-containing protein [Chloroflexi bacterium]|nr:DUF86 domain-containing protein [Chloroflexota bacterium]MCL5273476.1 DUF86 domain-containing protein [Chloroflexota bacterium]